MNEQNFWNWHNTFKKIPHQNLGGQLIKVDKKKILLVVGPNKKQLQLASYYCKNIVKLKLRWSYSSFKLISIEFKQNLGLGCSNFYFKMSKWKKKFKNFIHKNFVWARSEGSFEPPGLNVKPPMNTVGNQKKKKLLSIVLKWLISFQMFHNKSIGDKLFLVLIWIYNLNYYFVHS